MEMLIHIGILSIFISASVQECVDVSAFQTAYSYDIQNADIIEIKNDDFPSNIDINFANVQLVPDICPGGVKGLIEATQLYPNKYIVNMNVPDFYKFNLNYVVENLIYVGDRREHNHHVEACVIDFKNTAENITCNENLTRSVSYPNVKLASRNVIENPRLLDFIEKYPNKSLYSDMSILICGEGKIKHVRDNGHGFNVIYSDDDCEQKAMMHQHKLLAVIAPKPIKTNVLAPIFLYHDWCYEGVSDNYVTLYNCDDYIYALKAFIGRVEWSKVAIFSDNTAYSEAFESQLKSLLEERKVTYTVVRCVESVRSSVCEFSKDLRLLNEAGVRTFIANVDKRNAEALIELINKNGANERRPSWVFRHFTTRNIERIGDQYTVSLVPIDDSMNTVINNAISTIRTTYEKIIKNSGVQGRPLLRKAKKQLQKTKLPSKAYVYKNRNIWLELSLSKSNVDVTPKMDFSPQTDTDNCIVKRNNIYKPCDDTYLLVILVVLVVVAGCGLLTVVFVSKFDSRRQYTNLE